MTLLASFFSGQTLVTAGICIAALAVLFFAVHMIRSLIMKKKLDRTLDMEYGKKRN